MRKRRRVLIFFNRCYWEEGVPAKFVSLKAAFLQFYWRRGWLVSISGQWCGCVIVEVHLFKVLIFALR